MHYQTLAGFNEPNATKRIIYASNPLQRDEKFSVMRASLLTEDMLKWRKLWRKILHIVYVNLRVTYAYEER